MSEFNYTLLKLSIGQVGLVWIAEAPPLLIRIILPEANLSARSIIRRSFPDLQEGSAEKINGICRQLEEYDGGKDVNFPCPFLDHFPEDDFFRRVWTETGRIPRGEVRTYGEVARNISSPKAPRAVGNALACNPLPLIIPCHRVVRSNGKLGGFAGGIGQMWIKRHLLEREGVVFDNRGRVLSSSLEKGESNCSGSQNSGDRRQNRNGVYLPQPTDLFK